VNQAERFVRTDTLFTIEEIQADQERATHDLRTSVFEQLAARFHGAARG
jgi:hypothetical protein